MLASRGDMDCFVALLLAMTGKFLGSNNNRLIVGDASVIIEA
jgi:hypothetical protein